MGLNEATVNKQKADRRRFVLTAISRLQNPFTTSEANKALLEERIKGLDYLEILYPGQLPSQCLHYLKEFEKEGLLGKDYREFVVYPNDNWGNDYRNIPRKVTGYMWFFIDEPLSSKKGK